MNTEFFRILFLIAAEFFVYRFILILIGHLFTIIFRKDKHFYHERELSTSVLLYLVFTLVYFKTMVMLIPSLIDAYMDIYLLMVIYGIFSVFWAYLSWDMDHWFRPITFAQNKDVIIKKGILYAIVFVGAFVLGIHQTRSYVGAGSVDPLYNIANISILTVIIALDRVMNQIYLTATKRNK